jgi:high-affinity iron transporter
MLATGLIVFRETLEAALLVGILAAATRSVPQGRRWLGGGVLAGLAGSVCLAMGMVSVSQWANGLGQELMNAMVLGTALIMLAWHCIWVSAQAKGRAQAARQMGDAAARGARPLWALALAVALSVLREGAESALFVAGLVAGTPEGLPAVLVSAGLGLALGAGAGWVLFAGLRMIKPQSLFAVTQGLVLLLAGGVASQLAKVLNQADWLRLWSEKAWNVSASLPNDSALGMLLHGTVGYDASPMRIQLVFYVVTVGLIAILSYWAKRQVRHGSQTLATAAP